MSSTPGITVPDPDQLRRAAALWEIGVSARLVRRYASVAGGNWTRDPMTVDAIAKRIEQIGELAKRLPPEEIGVGTRGSAAMRDVLAHNYRRLDRAILADVLTNDIPLLASRSFQVPEPLLTTLRGSTRIVLITGIPGSGKTNLLRALPATTYAPHLGDEAGGWAPEMHEAWDAALAGEDGPLLVEAAASNRTVVVEWGFPARNLEVVRAMLGRGFEAYFLDGDDAAAMQAWRSAHPSDDPRVAMEQLSDLRAIDESIDDVFGDRRLKSVGSGPTFTDTIEIRRLIRM